MRGGWVYDGATRPWLLAAFAACGPAARAPANTTTGDAASHAGGDVDSSPPPQTEDAGVSDDGSFAGDGPVVLADAPVPAGAPASDGGRDLSNDRSPLLRPKPFRPARREI